MTTSPGTPQSDLAVALARADLAYLCAALMRPDDPTRGWVFLQYAVMTSYEARRYVRLQVGIEAPKAMWPEEMAAAARTSGKFFDDNRRYLPGVVDHFAGLIAANRSFFRPEVRRARWLDRVRRDMAVLLLEGVPVMTNVGGFFIAGLQPGQLRKQDELGPRLRDLAAGVGQTTAWIGAPQDHRGPLQLDAERFAWRDAHTAQVVAEVFCGDFDSPLAVAMLTIQNAVTAANLMSRTDCCASCRAAAVKHRLIVAYQAALALRQLRESGPMLSPAGAAHLQHALTDPHCVTLLGPGYRKLRNGLLHFGLTDLPVEAGSTLSLDEVLCRYTEEDSVAGVVATIEGALTAIARALEAWCLTGPKGGKGLHALLHWP